jgi:hypothetical protein
VTDGPLLPAMILCTIGFMSDNAKSPWSAAKANFLRVRWTDVGMRLENKWSSDWVIGELPLLAAWSAIGIGTALNNGFYGSSYVVIVAIGVLLIVTTLSLRPGFGKFTGQQGGMAVGAIVLTAILWPAGIYGTGQAIHASRLLTICAALILATWSILALPRATWIAYSVVLIMLAAGITQIIASPSPAIDVWYMLQATTHALGHGQNIYTVPWTSGVPGELSSQYVYLPGATILLWPFHVIFGDVRYGLLAALVVTGIALIRASIPAAIPLTAALFILYPKVLFGLEQSWIDPLTLCALALMGLAMMRGRRGWAVVAFAAALSCKQYNWLIIPFAVLWKDFGLRRTAIATAAAIGLTLPWVIANPKAFVSGAFTYNLHLGSRLDSLSLYTTLVLHHHIPGLKLPAALIVVVFVVAIWRLPRTESGFFLGSAAVIGVYDLFNRLSFYDAWECAGGLTLFAVVFGRATSGPSADSPGLRTSELRSDPRPPNDPVPTPTELGQTAVRGRLRIRGHAAEVAEIDDSVQPESQ